MRKKKLGTKIKVYATNEIGENEGDVEWHDFKILPNEQKSS